MRSSYSHRALSAPSCGQFIKSQVGDKDAVCVPVHACVLLFASASGNVLLSACVCMCLCGIADGEQLRRGNSDI